MIEIPRPLLAKSFEPGEYPDGPPSFALLTQHSRDVARVARALGDRYGALALAAMSLPATLLPALSRALVACGWMQDIGKCNSHFQEMVGGNANRAQLLRHEAISLLLFSREPLRGWISSFEEGSIALWAAAGHHRKFDRGISARDDCTPMRVCVSHSDLQAILDEMGRDLSLGAAPRFTSDITIGKSRHDGADIVASRELASIVDECENRARMMDASAHKLLSLVKAFGIAADVAASALARTTSPDRIGPSIQSMLDEGRLKSTDVDRLVRSWVRARFPEHQDKDLESLKTEVLRPFQRQVATSDSFVTLARAGCGAGKSIAAYLWAGEWAKRFEQEGRADYRLFFTLPTTGTTTEHFRDYALECGVPAELAELAHSRAKVDLLALSETASQEEPPEGLGAAEQAGRALDLMQRKIEALTLWSTPIVVSTSDTVLGLMSNGLKPLCSFPAIVSGGVVFDEVHAFDDSMFGHLLVFLRLFPKIPVLLMTASLQSERLDALATVRPDLNIIDGPADLECLERYAPHLADSSDEVNDSVHSTIAAGGKVLWVRNRVRWANETFAECRRRFPDAFVQVYHSRFRYRDRSRRHRCVIDHFKAKGQAILVATQVAEMSLDISADLLISDMAPVPALIQRMGRLNRHWSPGQPGQARRAFFMTIPPGETMPYEAEAVASARDWLSRLITYGRPVSQRDLGEEFGRTGAGREVDVRRAEKNAEFIAGVWETRVGQTRDDGNTVAVLLERDWNEWRISTGAGHPSREWLREHEVSIPMKPVVLGWERARYLPIAPSAAVTYHWDDRTEEGTGAEWN